MSCPIVIKTIDSLEKKGIYEHDTSRVLNKPAFIAYNDKWSQIAKDKFNLTNVDKMFNIVDGGLKKMLSGSSYLRDNTESITRAFVNKDFFKELQEKYDLANQPTDTTVNRITQINNKQKTEVKPGVAELFDSNPELANQVYEALGFETTSVDLTPSELTSKPIGSPLDQSEGTGICDGTCGLMANRLQQAGMPYGHTQIEDKIANYHAVALTEINGKRYILNQPQHEFLSIEYQKAPLWERAMFWRGMSQRFNRHLPRILNDLYFSEGINPYPALFGTIESEYFGEIGPIFKDKKIIKREGYSVVTGTLIENPSVRIAIKLEEGQTLETIDPEEADVQTTKDGEKIPVWTKTEFTPRFIEVTKENLIKEYQLTDKQADASIKAINEAIINPGTKTQITPQQKQQAQQLYSQYLDTKNRLYRSETSLRADETKAPDWLKEQPEIIAQQEAQGRWFYKSLKEAQEHSIKFEGDKITYIDVDGDVEQYNAKDNKFAGGYGREGREYFVSKELAKNRIELGSKQDIEGFKKFMKNTNKQNNTKIELNIDFDVDKLSDDLNLEKDCK